jgi:Spy/CpxP family protein refolding chaperone
MKKLLFLTLILSAILTTTTFAQAGDPAPAPPTPATMLQQMKEKQVPKMVEKTGLTEAQANRVIELNFEMRMAAGALKDLPAEERSKKIADLKAEKAKKMSELLTAEQLKAVDAFYQDMAKDMPKKTAN